MAVTAAEILQDIEDYILTGGRRTRADKLRMILDKMVELTEQGGGGSVDLENITTDLKFANTTSNRILERRLLSGSILQYLSKIQFGDNDLRLIVEDWATGGVLKDYASYQIIGGTFHNWTVGNVPSGVSNSMQLLIDRLNLNKVARYSSALPLDNDLDLVNKKWVADNFITINEMAGLTSYFFSSTNSDISGYESMPDLANYTSATEANNGGVTVSTTPTSLGKFATNSGFPNVTKIPIGLFPAHVEVEKAAGSNNYSTFFKLYKRNLAGTETLLVTSDYSSEVSANTRQQITVSAYISNPITLLATDRLVIEWYSVMNSSTATITMYYDGITNARFAMPVVSANSTQSQRITDTSVITAITNNANYNDAYGNPSPAYGGIWNTTLPSPIVENDYYIEPIGTPNGLPRSKIEVKKDSTGSLTIIKTPYIQ
jgi:hypothetical protein